MLHSPTMPRWRMVLIAIVRSIWYSSSFSVCDGATTMDSPVWMPIGSKFSMLQTVMQLSRPSRTTSYSISFQPAQALFDEHLRHAAGEGAAQRLVEIGLGVDDAAALAAERVAAAQHDRQPDLECRHARLGRRPAGAAARGLHADLGEALDEQPPVLGVADRLDGRAEHRTPCFASTP